MFTDDIQGHLQYYTLNRFVEFKQLSYENATHKQSTYILFPKKGTLRNFLQHIYIDVIDCPEDKQIF